MATPHRERPSSIRIRSCGPRGPFSFRTVSDSYARLDALAACSGFTFALFFATVAFPYCRLVALLALVVQTTAVGSRRAHQARRFS
jgi:hypothetical protein